MTQHTDLIERLRYEPTASQYLSLADLIASLHEDRKNAANALEAQVLEIAELKAQLAATAKNAFEAMPHDIPQRMKDAICEETGWSGSMVSRMYTELRKAFTGEPYRANEDLDAALLEIEALKAQESELCTLYGLAQAECKKLRAELERTANNRDMWKSQCERQADELRKLRKDAERYKFLRKCHWTDSPPTYVVTTLEGLKLNAMTYSDDRLDEVLDARVAANSTATQKGQP